MIEQPPMRHEDRPGDYYSEKLQSEVHLLSPHLGALIESVDILDKALNCDALRRVVAEHGVVTMRGLKLTPENLESLVVRLGAPIAHPLSRFALPESQWVTLLSNVRDVHGTLIGAHKSGMEWHSDRSFRPVPAQLTLLYGVECPPTGGETEFCSSYAIYEAATLEDRAFLDGAEGVHDYDWYWRTFRVDREPLSNAEAGPAVLHPATLDHELSQRRAIYLSQGATRGIKGMADLEAQALIERITTDGTELTSVYSHPWRAGDLVIWDNQAVVHRATPYEERFRRLMWRTQTEGTPPKRSLQRHDASV